MRHSLRTGLVAGLSALALTACSGDAASTSGASTDATTANSASSPQATTTAYSRPERRETSLEDQKTQALQQAKSSIGMIPTSRQSMIYFLEAQGFPPEAVDYAVDNVGADWGEEARKQVDVTIEAHADEGISRAMLEGVIGLSGFTDDEVAYAMEHTHVDWVDQAAIAARHARHTLGLSDEELVFHLAEWQQFTPDEIGAGLQELWDEEGRR